MFASRSSTSFGYPHVQNSNKQFGLEVNKYVVMSKFIKSAYEAEPKISMGYVPLPLPFSSSFLPLPRLSFSLTLT